MATTHVHKCSSTAVKHDTHHICVCRCGYEKPNRNEVKPGASWRLTDKFLPKSA